MLKYILSLFQTDRESDLEKFYRIEYKRDYEEMKKVGYRPSEDMIKEILHIS